MSDKVFCSCGRDPGEEHKPYCQITKLAVRGQGVSGDSELTQLRATAHRLESERDEAHQVAAEQGASIDQLRAALADAEGEREEAREGRTMWQGCAEFAAKERDTLKAENADLLAALQVVKEDRQKWWGKAVERNQQISTLKAECEAARDGFTISIKDAHSAMLELQKQLTTSREEGYRQGMERAAVIIEDKRIHKMADVDSIIKAIRAESCALPAPKCKDCVGYPVCVEASVPAEPCHAYESSTLPRTTNKENK